MRKQELIDANKHLQPLPEVNPWTKQLKLGSRNLKQELKRAFPNIKFSVRSSSYSMGCSISVSWILGPNEREVRKISDKYQYCHFDGMIDMEEYIPNDWSDTFGGAKYVQSQRGYYRYEDLNDNVHGWWDETIFGEVGKALCEMQNVEYKGIDTENVFGSCSRILREHVNEIVWITSFKAGEKYGGLKHAEDPCGGFEIVKIK